MTDDFDCDVLIIGGGIAGAWTQEVLRRQGYRVLLAEADRLGCRQSSMSQGIIHGGIKYALDGVLGSATNAIRGMPDQWRAALDGSGEIDLRAARQLSPYHYMWSTGSMFSKLALLAASKAVVSLMHEVPEAERPAAFRLAGFKGPLYALHEPVLDIPSVFSALAALNAGALIQARAERGSFTWQGERIVSVDLRLPDGQSFRVKPAAVILTAGEGQEELLGGLIEKGRPRMQRRPLHMVAVKHRFPHPVYAHCVGAATKPELTITTQFAADGAQVWTLGGNISEDGVSRSPDEQIAAGRKLLRDLTPWIDLGQAEWASWRVDRAEPHQSDGARPDNAFTAPVGNAIVAWPTKLALAPDLGRACIEHLGRFGTPRSGKCALPAGLGAPPVGPGPWVELFR